MEQIDLFPADSAMEHRYGPDWAERTQDEVRAEAFDVGLSLKRTPDGKWWGGWTFATPRLSIGNGSGAVMIGPFASRAETVDDLARSVLLRVQRRHRVQGATVVGWLVSVRNRTRN
jgi:hypothetical protein